MGKLILNNKSYTGSQDLSELTDVAISSPQNNEVLAYNSTTHKWENKTGGGGGATDLDDLSDVSVTSASNGQVLKYNNGTWENANETTGSTVSVTQVQSTGTKIATITVDSVNTDLYAPTGGGSSSLAGLSDVDLTSPTSGQVLKYDGSDWVNASESGGGHVILDNSGTSLTQQPNLQFKGAYSEDNNTDSVTEVNIVRSMTKAEFDLLSADEKVGIINITDESTGLGTWTDITGTLTAGQTSITLSDASITTSSTIEVFDDLDVPYNSKTLNTGSITLTFDAQASVMTVKVRVS